MKRGLVILDPDEVPEGEWDERLAAVRADLAAEGVDVALVYGDTYSSDDIAYLTNLCIYWNEGMMAIRPQGPPVLLTKLSPRVFPWMRLTSKAEDIRSGRKFGALVSGLLDEPGAVAGTVGLVGAARWPASVVEEVTAALPGWTVRPLGPVIRDLRASPSTHEEALLRTASSALHAAVGEAGRPGLTNAERVSALERLLRGAGFLDVRIGTSAASDGTESLRVTGQYRTVWAHVARVLPGGRGAAVEAVLHAATGAAVAGATVADLVAAAGPAIAELPADALVDVRWIDQADLATLGEYAGRGDTARLRDGAIGAISVEVVLADGGSVTAAETVRIGSSGAERLTGTEAVTQ
jgi:Creatinase/Prolidase N-terminal domain